MKSTPENHLQKLMNLIKSDPKRAVVLGVLVLVLTGIWVKRHISAANPAAAVAAPSVSVPTSPTLGQPSRSDSRDSAIDKAALEEWVRQPIAPLGRNLFSIKLDYYPQDGSAAGPVLKAPTGDGFWDELAKSMTSQADQKRERQILIENLRLQAAQLRLQSIMMGAPPKALINGQLVREGDVVASFRVLKIEPRRIIVEREGIKLEILMK